MESILDRTNKHPRKGLWCDGNCGRWIVTGYLMIKRNKPRQNRMYCEECIRRVRVEAYAPN